MSDRHCVVVGGGISGLAAAWEASRTSRWRVTVVEASPDLGGKLRTSEFCGRPVDEGADAFLRRVPEALQLCQEVGLSGLIAPGTGRAKVWVRGELRPLPTGLALGVPVDPDALAASGVVGEVAVAAARKEGARPALPLRGDASLGRYLRERLGDEIADVLVEPLLGGIYAGSVDDMSLDATAPAMAEVAHRGVPLTRGLASAPGDTAAGDQPVFAAPCGGMAALVSALAAALTSRGAVVRTTTPVRGLAVGPDATRVVLAHEELAADAVVLASPSGAASELIAATSPGAAELLRAVPSASVVLVTLAYAEVDVPVALDAAGFLVPRTDPALRITAASWATTKWPQLRRDDGVAILRVSLGHADDPGAIHLSDAEVLDRVALDLERTMGIGATPLATRISRWRDGFPQYRPGHLERVDRIEARLASDAPRLAVTGAWARGVGIPACVRQARRTTRELLAR